MTACSPRKQGARPLSSLIQPTIPRARRRARQCQWRRQRRRQRRPRRARPSPRTSPSRTSTARYDQTQALAGVDLDIAPGEVVCLLGPSGCGKTTLLRIAAGIEKPTAGRVLINELEVAGPDRASCRRKQRGVGLMFQDFALFPHLTILDNVAFGLKSLPARGARARRWRRWRASGSRTYADEYPHILSGGQQQRVALARAIVPRPAVMLMDEPFSGLDVQLREQHAGGDAGAAARDARDLA